MGITGYDCGNEAYACVQFDAIMGFVNSVQEMLIYSAPGIVKLLPACPKEFNTGTYRLNFADGTVTVIWNKEEQSCHGTVTAKRSTSFSLVLPFGEEKINVSLSCGETFEF